MTSEELERKYLEEGETAVVPAAQGHQASLLWKQKLASLDKYYEANSSFEGHAPFLT